MRLVDLFSLLQFYWKEAEHLLAVTLKFVSGFIKTWLLDFNHLWEFHVLFMLYINLPQI